MKKTVLTFGLIGGVMISALMFVNRSVRGRYWFRQSAIRRLHRDGAFRS